MSVCIVCYRAGCLNLMEHNNIEDMQYGHWHWLWFISLLYPVFVQYKCLMATRVLMNCSWLAAKANLNIQTWMPLNIFMRFRAESHPEITLPMRIWNTVYIISNWWKGRKRLVQAHNHLHSSHSKKYVLLHNAQQLKPLTTLGNTLGIVISYTTQDSFLIISQIGMIWSKQMRIVLK